MTVLETLTAAAGYLTKHGIESPRLNAEHLLAHVLGKKRLDLYLEFDRPLSDAERAPLRELIRDRGNGRPLQHLMGTAEFFGRSFLCDTRALIPRPETEQLVEIVLAIVAPTPSTSPSSSLNPQPPGASGAAQGGQASTLLDIGTGSGVIALTLALELPGAEVSATDISPAALELAKGNANRHTLGNSVTFFEADLFPPGETRFDLIIANLPYIASADLASLQLEVRQDPALALDGGPDGLAVIERLITQSPHRLTEGGTLALEIGHNQAARVREILAKHGFQKIAIRKDFHEIERFVLASQKDKGGLF
jgi:release factor glutamine methyltransferase